MLTHPHQRWRPRPDRNEGISSPRIPDLQFDAGQRLLKRSDNKEISGIPVYYQTELLAIAMGAEPETIGLQYHMIQPNFELLQSNKAIPATTAPN